MPFFLSIFILLTYLLNLLYWKTMQMKTCCCYILQRYNIKKKRIALGSQSFLSFLACRAEAVNFKFMILNHIICQHLFYFVHWAYVNFFRSAAKITNKVM